RARRNAAQWRCSRPGRCRSRPHGAGVGGCVRPADRPAPAAPPGDRPGGPRHAAHPARRGDTPVGYVDDRPPHAAATAAGRLGRRLADDRAAVDQQALTAEIHWRPGTGAQAGSAGQPALSPRSAEHTPLILVSWPAIMISATPAM